MTTVANIVATIVNFWDGLPEWLRKGLRDAAVGAVAAVSALNLAVPGTLDQVKAEALIAVVAAGAAVLAIVRVEILPPLFTWLIGSLGLHHTGQVGKNKPLKLVRYN